MLVQDRQKWLILPILPDTARADGKMPEIESIYVQRFHDFFLLL